uniref:CDT1 Geminin-binding domain-containing protein n=1 Tax=Ditylenchus dipsaci TaxID=166011 RepID=A0A915E571_9BILA
MRITFDNVSKNVMKNTKMTFKESHLSQIVAVYSKAYDLKWEKHRQVMGKTVAGQKYDLVILPNLKDDLEPFLTEQAKEKMLLLKSPARCLFSPINQSPVKQLSTTPVKIDRAELLKSPTKTVKLSRTPVKQEPMLSKQDENYCFVSPSKNLISPVKRMDRDVIRKSPTKMPNTPVRRLVLSDPAPKMEGWRLTARKMVFRHFLVEHLKNLHKQFLATEKVTIASKQLLHPDFKLESVADIPSTSLPQQPKTETPLRTMRDFLQTVTPVKLEAKLDVAKEPESSPVKTPSQPLLERIRAKEAALKRAKEQKDPGLERRRTILYMLKQSMVEVICSHFGLKKVSSMNVDQLQKMVVLSCGKMSRENFLEHLDVLCSVAPKICSKETFLKTTAFKLSEARFDEILECVEEELHKVDKILDIKTEV